LSRAHNEVRSARLNKRNRDLIQHRGDFVIAKHLGQWWPGSHDHLPGQATGKMSEDGITPFRKPTGEAE
jgi:hypothetical protein